MASWRDLRSSVSLTSSALVLKTRHQTVSSKEVMAYPFFCQQRLLFMIHRSGIHLLLGEPAERVLLLGLEQQIDAGGDGGLVSLASIGGVAAQGNIFSAVSLRT